MKTVGGSPSNVVLDTRTIDFVPVKPFRRSAPDRTDRCREWTGPLTLRPTEVAIWAAPRTTSLTSEKNAVAMALTSRGRRLCSSGRHASADVSHPVELRFECLKRVVDVRGRHALVGPLATIEDQQFLRQVARGVRYTDRRGLSLGEAVSRCRSRPPRARPTRSR